MPLKKKTYIDDEADASSKGSSESSDASDYEKDSFIATSEDEASDNENAKAPPAKRAKGVVVSNKKIDASSVPAKPTAKIVVAAGPDFFFKMTFTNGILLRKFMEPVAHSVKKIRFALVKTPGFSGFRMEAHDAQFTLANKSRFECDVEVGKAVHGGLMTDEEINKYIFCVRAKSFMEALTASALKETTLTISRQHATPDLITFESVNNENDMRTVQTCNTIENTEVDSLDEIHINLGFHVTVHMSTLKELSLNAKRCGASTLKFELFEGDDPKDSNVKHSKMSIGFAGDETNGSHDFFLSTRRSTKMIDDKSVVVWDPMPGLSMNNQSGLSMEKKCSNEQDNSKLRLFLNHMECNWVLVHLGNDNTQQPLVLDCKLGGENTKHTIIVAPKMDAAN